jgi:hypothetical protein
MRLVCLASCVLLVLLAACDSDDEAAPSGSAQRGTVGAASTPDEPPARIVALTSAGDVVVIDRLESARVEKLATYPWRRDEETGIIYGRAEDVTVLADGRLLVSTCCEPAGGAVDVLDETGERATELVGWDPQVDPAGTKVAVAGIIGIAIHDASAVAVPERMVEVDPAPDSPSWQPEDPAWSPDAQELAFTLGGSLGIVPVGAETLAEAEILEPGDGTYWASPAFTTDGVVAVEQSGSWEHERTGPSRLVSLDLATGGAVELASSNGPMSDVTVDPSGHHLLWVEKGRLRWRTGEALSSFEGDFVAAAWMPERASAP